MSRLEIGAVEIDWPRSFSIKMAVGKGSLGIRASSDRNEGNFAFEVLHSILSGTLNILDDDHRKRSLLRFESKTELFPNRDLKRGFIVIRRRRLVP